MSRKNFSEAKLEELEKMVDTYGLTGTVEALASIASMKAQHIEEDWQDSATARTWDRDATKLERCAKALYNR